MSVEFWPPQPEDIKNYQFAAYTAEDFQLLNQEAFEDLEQIGASDYIIGLNKALLALFGQEDRILDSVRAFSASMGSGLAMVNMTPFAEFPYAEEMTLFDFDSAQAALAYTLGLENTDDILSTLKKEPHLLLMAANRAERQIAPETLSTIYREVLEPQFDQTPTEQLEKLARIGFAFGYVWGCKAASLDAEASDLRRHNIDAIAELTNFMPLSPSEASKLFLDN